MDSYFFLKPLVEVISTFFFFLEKSEITCIAHQQVYRRSQGFTYTMEKGEMSAWWCCRPLYKGPCIFTSNIFLHTFFNLPLCVLLYASAFRLICRNKTMRSRRGTRHTLRNDVRNADPRSAATKFLPTNLFFPRFSWIFSLFCVSRDQSVGNNPPWPTHTLARAHNNSNKTGPQQHKDQSMFRKML